MEFPLLTEAVEFRGQTFTVQELDADQFAEWAAAMRKDPSIRLQEAARLGTVEPKFKDLEQVRKLPAALVIKLAGKILELSEVDDAPKAEAPKSETSTG